jgi:YidC/Oxa1 family membrane protein insertase
MWLFYQLGNNYVLSLFLFTLLTRVALFPINAKQQRSTAAMTAFSPKLEALKAKYGNNKEKLNEETMKLYTEEGINPMAGCLPMFIQLPLLWGMFDVVYRPLTHLLHIDKETINKAIEMLRPLYVSQEANFNSRPELYIVEKIQNNPQFFSSLPELGEKLQGFSMNLFGFIDLTATPDITPAVWNAASIGLIMIPIISFLIQLGSAIYMGKRQKAMQKASGTDQSQNPMAKSMTTTMYMMPLITLWISFGFPAGVGLYWCLSGLFAVVQMYILNKVYTPEYVAKLVEAEKLKKKDKTKKRASMMERYQKLLEEQESRANETANAVRRNTITMSGGSADKITKSQQKDIERTLINEARRRYAEKYGDEYKDD